MSKRICITSYRSVGCTFLDWSIHYLSGQDKYYNVHSNRWLELSPNPVAKTNAHGHQKNHPLGYHITKNYMERADKLPNHSIFSMYPRKLYLDVAANKMNIPVEQFCNSSMFDQVVQFVHNDYNKILDLCSENKFQLIFVGHDSRVTLYHQAVRVLERFSTRPGSLKSEQEHFEDFQTSFFSNSIATWKELKLTDVWDIRERASLDLRPNDWLPKYKFNLTQPHLYIDCLDLWTRTDAVVYKIMKYLELHIDSTRLQSWLPICKEWQQKQLDILEFVYNQPHIVESIVNNWYYEIDLTFQQEILIQHFLIYQYGLNLKTWQLSKFPNNTQDLHKLLEPNIHQVPKIY